MKKLFTIVFTLFLCFSSIAQEAQKREIEKLRKEIEQLDKQIKANEGKSADATAKLTLVNKKIETSKKLVASSEKELAQINSRIRSKKQEIELTETQLEQSLSYYESLIRNAYLSRDPKLRFLYILSGNSLSQVIRRFNYLRSASDNLRDEAKRISAQRDLLTAQKSHLEALQKENIALLSIRNKELSELKKEQKKQQNLIATLKQNKSKYIQEQKKKSAQITQLNKKITELIAAQKKRQKAAASDFAKHKGNLPWPVEGTVVGKYGKHKHPVHKNINLPFNNGIDISTEAMAKVSAVYNGVVCNVVVMPGYNQCVLVQHGEYYTFYCRLKSVKVKAGDKIKCGDQIGVVDTINGETQLHFELWKGTSSQNPEPWLL